MNWSMIWKGWNAHLERMRRLPTRRERRRWVAVLFLSMATGDTLIVANKTPDGTSSLWGLLGGLIGLLSVLLVWNRLVAWSMPVVTMPHWPEISVDERQQFVRDRSFRRAYQAVFLLTLVAAVATHIFQDDLPGILRRISALHLLPVATTQIIIFIATLPIACLAWTEPDESEGKREDDLGGQEGSTAGS